MLSARACFVLVITLATLGYGAASEEIRFTANRLPVADGSIFLGVSLNDRGEVLGKTLGPGSDGTAYVWSRSAGYTPVGAFNVLALRPNFSYGHYLNAREQVCGCYEDDLVTPFVWDRSSGTQWIPDLSGPNICLGLAGINDGGAVAGNMLTTSNDYHAFYWDARAGVADIGVLSGDSSYAVDINNSGCVLGMSTKHFANRYCPFLWQNGVMREIETPPGIVDIRPTCLNDNGEVAGMYYGSGKPPYCGFIWDKEHGFRDLGVTGEWNAIADMNESGVIVGTDAKHPFIRLDGINRDVRSLTYPAGKWTISNVTAVNNRGQVLGLGKRQDQSNLSACVLTPAPTVSLIQAEPICYMTQDEGRTAVVSLRAQIQSAQSPDQITWRLVANDSSFARIFNLSVDECTSTAWDYHLTGIGGPMTYTAEVAQDAEVFLAAPCQVDIRGYKEVPTAAITRCLRSLYGPLLVGLAESESRFYSGNAGQFDAKNRLPLIGRGVGLMQIEPVKHPEWRDLSSYWDWKANAERGAEAFRICLSDVDVLAREERARAVGRGFVLPALTLEQREDWAICRYKGMVHRVFIPEPTSNPREYHWALNPSFPQSQTAINSVRNAARKITGDTAVLGGTVK